MKIPVQFCLFMVNPSGNHSVLKFGLNGAVQILTLISCMLLVSTAKCGEDIILNRYSKQNMTAEPQQTDPLSVVIEINFPSTVVTVEDAIDYLLLQSGYRYLYEDDIEIRNLLSLSLPRVHRKLGPISLRSALETLAGSPWNLVENEVNRTVQFKLREEFNHFASDQNHLNTASNTNETNPFSPSVNTIPISTWQLKKAHTLFDTFNEWTEKIGWTLEWTASHDYVVSHDAEFKGTFQNAVKKTLEFYRTAPIPLNARFYTGNSVLVVETSKTEN